MPTMMMSKVFCNLSLATGGNGNYDDNDSYDDNGDDDDDDGDDDDNDEKSLLQSKSGHRCTS